MPKPMEERTIVATVGVYSRKHAVTIVHEYDSGMWHRLRCGGIFGTWASYADIAELDYGIVKMKATTEHWWPDLPEIFEISVIKEHEPWMWAQDDESSGNSPAELRRSSMGAGKDSDGSAA